MNKNEFLEMVNNNRVDPSHIMQLYLIDKNPEMPATKVGEIVSLVFNRQMVLPAVVNTCIAYFEEKVGAYKLFNKNGLFLKYV